MGTGKPVPNAGRPKGLGLLLASAPLQGAVAVAAGHGDKWRERALSLDVPIHPGLTFFWKKPP